MQVFKAHDPGSTDFFWELRKFDAFDVVFFSPTANPSKPDHLWLWFNAAIKHQGITQLAIDYSMQAYLRGPVEDPLTFPTDPFARPLPPQIIGANNASNILNTTQHYAQVCFTGYEKLTVPGWYRVEIHGKSRSDAVPEFTNGLAEIHQEPTILNQLIVRVED
jgi:hypothetical protein